jgi:hypothetical protein
MKNKRNKDEINRQIEGLAKMKKTLPKHSMFGDKNWEKIEAQIAILQGKATPDDYYQDESAEEFQDGDNDIWSDAERAQQWLKGDDDEDLFE